MLEIYKSSVYLRKNDVFIRFVMLLQLQKCTVVAFTPPYHPIAFILEYNYIYFYCNNTHSTTPPTIPHLAPPLVFICDELYYSVL